MGLSPFYYPLSSWICNEAEACHPRQTGAVELSPFLLFIWTKTNKKGVQPDWNVSVLLVVVGHWLYATNKWLTDGLIDFD